MVIDGITTGGQTDAPINATRFLDCIDGVIATALCGDGSDALSAIQAAAIALGLPTDDAHAYYVSWLFEALTRRFAYCCITQSIVPRFPSLGSNVLCTLQRFFVNIIEPHARGKGVQYR